MSTTIVLKTIAEARGSHKNAKREPICFTDDDRQEGLSRLGIP